MPQTGMKEHQPINIWFGFLWRQYVSSKSVVFKGKQNDHPKSI